MKKLSTVALLLLATAGVALAQNAPAGGAPQQGGGGAPQNPPPPPARGPSLDLAIEAAQAAMEASKAGDQKVAVSVIDSAGVLKAVLVSDGVGPRAVQNSNFKAQAALAFKEPSGAFAEQIKTTRRSPIRLRRTPATSPAPEPSSSRSMTKSSA